ncbi:MAG: prepilin peptidase [Actinobacteria bacterium]|nr:MAG: prepilin peptidase [Actinomycetota bacterium]
MSASSALTSREPTDTGGARTPSKVLLPRPALLVPIVVGLVVLALLTFPLDRALVAASLAGVLVVLSALDVQRGIIPNRIVLPASAILLLAQVALFPNRAQEWVLAGLLAAVVLAIPPLLGRRWMGMGDAKLALLIGVGLGWGVFGAVLIAFLCVFPVALLLLLLRGGLAARKTTIPFGPFLSLGALIVLFGPHLAGLPTS